MDFERVGEEDREEIFALMHAAVRAECVRAYGALTVEAWLDPANTTFEFRVDPDNFGLRRDGELIAYSSWVPQPGAEDTARVTSAYVRPDRMGEGLGRVVMERALQDIAAKGFAHVILFATRNAAPFYERMGFAGNTPQLIAVAPRHYITALRMERPVGE